MAITYESIGSFTVTSPQTTMSVTGIPATYSDLVVIVNSRSAATGNYATAQVQFNSDGGSGSKYSSSGLISHGGSASASEIQINQTSGRIGRLSTSFNGYSGFSSTIMHIINYTTTSYDKSYVTYCEASNEFYQTSGFSGLYRNTAAINAITILQDTSSNFVVGSSIQVFGILRA